MPERSSAPLDSPELVGDPISSTGAPAAREVPERPIDVAESTEANPPARPLPVPPLPPDPPPPPSQVAEIARPELDTGETEGDGHRSWRSLLFSRETCGWLVSCVFHASLLLILGMIVEAVRPGPSGPSLVAYMSGPVPLENVYEELDREVHLPRSHRAIGEVALTREALPVPEVALPLEEPSGSGSSPGSRFGLDPPASIELFPPADAPTGGGLEGRGAARARLAADDGGTPDSEGAVERGLRWLHTYQREDGSWNFDHNKGRHSGFCRNPGTVASTTAATAIALAPFLGAGYTHLGGDYQDTVHRGLYYLKTRALVTPNGVDLQEGTMYAQGLAAIVLCEAYAMTGDPGLEDIAQRALEFIDYAQDKRGGGWRYTPGEPGDTTVTGWQLMALKSGQMANLHVRSPSVMLACQFLNSVSCEDGARYGYMSTDPRKTTTAVGLLCRMYTGWRRSNPGLRVGVAYLSEWGPSEDNMYYNYYATQVVRHWGGQEWEEWNPKMRDYLIATQSNHAHEAGSWYFSGGHGESGGRLYNTAMAVMTLEVYYRYMPLYRQKAFGD